MTPSLITSPLVSKSEKRRKHTGGCGGTINHSTKVGVENEDDDAFMKRTKEKFVKLMKFDMEQSLKET